MLRIEPDIVLSDAFMPCSAFGVVLMYEGVSNVIFRMRDKTLYIDVDSIRLGVGLGTLWEKC